MSALYHSHPIAAKEALLPRRIVIEHLTRDEWKSDLFLLFDRMGYRPAGCTRGNSLFQRQV